MKRYIRAVALILALVTFFMVPVSANDLSVNGVYDVMPYLPQKFFTATPSDGLFAFDIPLDSVYFVDFVFRKGGGSLNSVSLVYAEVELEVLSLGNNLYRAYGYTYGYSMDEIDLYFDVSSDAYISFLSGYVGSAAINRFDSIGYFTINWTDAGLTSYNITKTMPGVNQFVEYSDFGDIVDTNESGYMKPYPFYVYVSDTNWKKF